MVRAGEFSFSEDYSWIGDWAGQRASLTPERVAIYDNLEDKTFTYKELNIRANKLARVLLNFGISKGDRVAVFSTNRIECVDLFLATGKIGAILVPFNVRLSLQELEYLIRKTSPSIFFYDPKLESQAVDIKSKGLIGRNIVLGGKSIQNDPTSYHLMNKALKSEIEKPSINFEDPHLILFYRWNNKFTKGCYSFS